MIFLAAGVEAAHEPYSFQGRFDTKAIAEAKARAACLCHEVPGVRRDAASDSLTVARFSLSGQDTRLTDALILAERVHAALVELSDGSSVFTGCDEFQWMGMTQEALPL